MIKGFFLINTDDKQWQPSAIASKVWVKDLGQADGYAMQQVKFEPGAFFPPHTHKKAEFMFILKGSLFQNGRELRQGFASIAESGTQDLTVFTHGGCEFILVSEV